MPTVLVEKDRCKGCGLCVSACPSHVLAMTQEINAKGYFYPMVEHPDDCNGCRHCALVCPDVAVQVEVKGKATERPEALNDLPMHYCPGCTHGVIHRLVAEAIDALGIRERTVGIAPVGCGVLAYEYFNCDMHEAAHGRAMAVATGVKRGPARVDRLHLPGRRRSGLHRDGRDDPHCQPGREGHGHLREQRHLRYDGRPDGPDHAAGPGGLHQPARPDVALAGYPIRVVELLKELKTPAYLARVSVHDAKAILQARKAIRTAFQHQVDGTCFSLIEILSTCPTGWGLMPHEACGWLAEHMIPYYPLGSSRTPSRG